MSYYEGVQWLGEATDTIGRSIRRWVTDYNPSSAKLRVTDNDLTRLTIKSAVATHPVAMYVETSPIRKTAGLEGRLLARTTEEFMNLLVESSGMLTSAQQANHSRSIWGTYGIGLRMIATKREVNGEPRADAVVKSFCFEPHHLILDPGNQCRDLREHEYVIYWSVMSTRKIKETYGVTLDEEQSRPMGQLMAVEQTFNAMTNGRLYGDYFANSRTPAAIVYEMYRKDDNGRFGKYNVMIETAKGEFLEPFGEDDENPWGGDGLPFVELFGHRRGDTRWGIGDVDMMKEDQDRRNLLATLLYRTVQKSAHYIWQVDKRWFSGKSEEEIKRAFTNTVGGILIGKGTSREQAVDQPKLVDVPNPPTVLESMIQLRGDQMREKSFRAEPQFGQTKSHVPATTAQAAIRAADDVASVRVGEDIKSYITLLNVILGTGVKLLKLKSPSLSASLVEADFDAERVAQLMDLNENRPQIRLNLSERSVRFRSHDERRRDVDAAMNAGIIEAPDYRQMLARDLDTPLLGNDTLMSAEAQDATDRILSGEQWEPIPLGQYTGYYLSEFRAGLADNRAEDDPETRARLVAAIDSQEQFEAQRQVQLSPEFMIAQMQAQQQAAQAQQQQEQAAPDSVDISQFVSQAVAQQ